MRELGAKGANPRERFEAAARFVQDLTYVSAQMDLGRGGGYMAAPAHIIQSDTPMANVEAFIDAVLKHGCY